MHMNANTNHHSDEKQPDTHTRSEHMKNPNPSEYETSSHHTNGLKNSQTPPGQSVKMADMRDVLEDMEKLEKVCAHLGVLFPKSTLAQGLASQNQTGHYFVYPPKQ